MTGVRLEVDATDLRRIQAKIDRLAGADFNRLLDDIGGLMESSTRRRIAADKESPSGEPWPAWSPRYAATRHSGHSLLQGEGDLLDSMTYNVLTGGGVEVGSNLVYAATHQFGDRERNIPARPYLGLSSEDLREIERLTDGYVEGLLQ